MRRCFPAIALPWWRCLRRHEAGRAAPGSPPPSLRKESQDGSSCLLSCIPGRRVRFGRRPPSSRSSGSHSSAEGFAWKGAQIVEAHDGFDRHPFFRVRVRVTTARWPIRSATGSRVRIRTGRSPPPGTASNQSSPLCIALVQPAGEIRPVLGRPPVLRCSEGQFFLSEWLTLVCACVVLAGEAGEIGHQGISKKSGAVHAKALRPTRKLTIAVMRRMLPLPYKGWPCSTMGHWRLL